MVSGQLGRTRQMHPLGVHSLWGRQITNINYDYITIIQKHILILLSLKSGYVLETNNYIMMPDIHYGVLYYFCLHTKSSTSTWSSLISLSFNLIHYIIWEGNQNLSGQCMNPQNFGCFQLLKFYFLWLWQYSHSSESQKSCPNLAELFPATLSLE